MAFTKPQILVPGGNLKTVVRTGDNGHHHIRVAGIPHDVSRPMSVPRRTIEIMFAGEGESGSRDMAEHPVRRMVEFLSASGHVDPGPVVVVTHVAGVSSLPGRIRV
jgi:hypothetical protein